MNQDPFFLKKGLRLMKSLMHLRQDFYEKLLKIDPLVKNSIKSSDVQRSIRAYEVKMFTKKSIVQWYENTKSEFRRENFYKIIIDFPRPKLVERINYRTEEIFKLGALSEVKKFLKLKISKNKSISKAIGVNEIKEYLNKLAIKEDISDKISIKTRQYAKRQMTWARGNMVGWKKINPNRLNNFLKKI